MTEHRAPPGLRGRPRAAEDARTTKPDASAAAPTTMLRRLDPDVFQCRVHLEDLGLPVHVPSRADCESEVSTF